MPLIKGFDPNPDVSLVPDVVYGSPVTVYGANLPQDVKAFELNLGGYDIGPPSFIAKDSLTFIVPQEVKRTHDTEPLALATHLLRVSVKGPSGSYNKMTAVSFRAGYLHVVSETRPPLALTSIEPAVVSPVTQRLVLLGAGFAGRVQDFKLLRDGREVNLCWPGARTEQSANAEDCVGNKARFRSPYQLEVDGPFDESWQGSYRLSLRRGDVVADGPASGVRFIKHSPQTIRFYSVGITALVMFVILWIASKTAGKHEVRAPGSEPRLVSALLIDPATDTYSLHKFQCFAWLLAGLIAYVYLSLSRGLGQGLIDIADVPENLPTMLGLSLGTSVASVGVSKVRGPKGAGPVHPSLSDLVSSGGVVAPERCSLLTWTIVAIAVFLFSVFRIDPTVISALPAIPERLLYLSGVGAAGYLAGKMARGPGPIIDEIVATVGSLDLVIMGQNLARDAAVTIAGVSVTPFLDLERHPDLRPVADKPDPVTGFSKTLQLRLIAAPSEWRDKDDLQLTVVNSDGQAAAWTVALNDALKTHLTILPQSLTSARPPI